VGDIPQNMLSEVEEWRSKMIESIAEYNDSILEKFFEDPDSITEEKKSLQSGRRP
jgi:elongation factor G